MKRFTCFVGARVWVIALTVFMCFACGKEKESFWEFENTSMSFPAKGGTLKVSLVGTGDVYSFICRSSQNWCTVSKSGTVVNVSVSANTGVSSRQAYVYLINANTDEASSVLCVSQSMGQGSSGGSSDDYDDSYDDDYDDGDDNNGSSGGSSGGGSGVRPSAPTSVSVANTGTVAYPYVVVSWDRVSGATGYSVYRSSSASGGYSYLGRASGTSYRDAGCRLGNVYYYKVKAENGVGSSDYSAYAKFDFKDTRKPGIAQYGYCSVSGTTMTIRWSVPSGDYGTPTKALLRVKHPDNDTYTTLKELPGTATSASFAYTGWVNSGGFVYVGIILENENGTGGGVPKVYDNKNHKWIN